MNKVIFITGTDTGVGKTYISGLIAKAIKEKNINVGYFKPVETGCSPKCEDAQKLAKITGQSLEEVVLYKFKHPVAPFVAEKLENKKINFNKIKEQINKLSKIYEFLIVEGAGGVMVPITKEKDKIITYLDLVEQLKMSVIVVARANLGTINHTVLTVKALEKINAKVDAVILNKASQNPDIAEKTNPEILKEMIGIKNIFKVYKNQKNLNLNKITADIVNIS